MNKANFFFLQLKRTFKNIRLLLLLAIFLVCMILLSVKKDNAIDEKITVGVTLSSDDPLSVLLYERLCALEDSLFAFTSVSSEEELCRLVQNGTFECGYHIKEPLLYSLNKQRKNNLVTVYVSERTTCKAIINELVYAKLFEEYALHIARHCVEEDDMLPFTKDEALSFSLPPVTLETMREIYDSYLYEGGTFAFEVTTKDDTTSQQRITQAAATTTMFHGFIAIFLFLGGFLSLLFYKQDIENGLADRFHGSDRLLAKVLSMSAVLLPCVLVSFLSLLITKEYTSLLFEAVLLLFYALLLLVYFLLLSMPVKSVTALCGAFPVLLLCSLVLTPVFTDVSTLLPIVRVLRYLLPTNYYMLFL